MIIEKFPYTPLNRVTKPNGARHYLCPQTGAFLPSVTTILDKTADKTGLLEWRKRVGEQEAERIKHEALGLGTLMHTHLECYIADQPRPTGTNLVRQQAEAMADQIIEFGLCKVDAVFGSEVGLYCPGLYAGTADLLCNYDKSLAVGDFKTAKKLKRKEHIEDYFMQLVAYGTAHDELYGTEINTGVIFMVDRDFNFKEFVITGDEFLHYREKWFDRLEQYFAAIKISQQ